MKMLLIIYDSVLDEEVMEALNTCCVMGYTKWEKVVGKGARSEPKMDNAVWPGYNSAILVAAEPGVEEAVFQSMRSLCNRLGERAVKVFSWPLEKVI
jgi:hypothetical protein